MSDMSQGPGWWLASDGKWYPPGSGSGGRPSTPDAISKPGSRKGVLVLIGVIAVALIAGGVTAAVIISGSNRAVYPAEALPSSPSSTTNAVTAANEVRGCMQAHQMAYAKVIVKNYNVSTPAFLTSNPEPYSSSDPVYSGGTPTVTAFES